MAPKTTTLPTIPTTIGAVGNVPFSGIGSATDAADAEADPDTVELDRAEIDGADKPDREGGEGKKEAVDATADEVCGIILVVGVGDAVGMPVGTNTLFKSDTNSGIARHGPNVLR